MAEVEKRFDRYPHYNKLSEEQQQEFKKGLFLSKGAVNNDVGCLLAYFGLTGEDIAKYGASWKDAKGIDQGCILHHRKPEKNFRKYFTRKLLVQQAVRIPDVFDTIRGRSLVAKYGDEVKEEFCDKNGKCPVSAIDRKESTRCEKLLSGVEFMDGTVTEYAFSGVKRYVTEDRNLELDASKASKWEFLERAKATEVVKAKSKGVDLAEIYAKCLVNEYTATTHSMDDCPEFKKDFWGFVEQDFYALANAPEETFKQLRVPEEAKFEDLTLLSTSIGRHFTGYYCPHAEDYSALPGAPFNSLYIRAMYQSLDEMGAGLATTARIDRCSRGMLRTRVHKIAKKVISLNEKYQKMLRTKSNKVAPAVLRQTLVGMFNEYADRMCLGYRMFIREDRPAPTLVELLPTKKSKSATTKATRAPRKRSTGPKEVVEVEGVGTFVEY